MFRTRHACALCLDSVCTECAAHRAELPVSPNRLAAGPQRVCDACYGVLQHAVGSAAVPVLAREAARGAAVTFDNWQAVAEQ